MSRLLRLAKIPWRSLLVTLSPFASSAWVISWLLTVSLLVVRAAQLVLTETMKRTKEQDLAAETSQSGSRNSSESKDPEAIAGTDAAYQEMEKRLLDTEKVSLRQK